MEDGMLTLLFLAAVTVFLIFKLKGVLGTKTGQEKPPAQVYRTQTDDRPAPVDVVEEVEVDPNDPTAVAIQKMQSIEPDFSPDDFVNGAKRAYEMLLMAFENGDKTTLQKFLSPDVFQSFADVIDQRADEGLSVDARFVGLKEAAITAARFDEEDNVAEIDIKFVGEMVTVVRDKAHRIVEGDPNEIRREHDNWTFGRRMGAPDPNWLLIATGA